MPAHLAGDRVEAVRPLRARSRKTPGEDPIAEIAPVKPEAA
nr:hypothetical protein [Streptomyces sp. CHD11]